MKIIQDEDLQTATSVASRINETPGQTRHRVIAKQDKAILFAVKPGAYTPLDDKHFADGAPAENDAQGTEFLEWFSNAEIGSRPPSRRKAISLEKY